MPTTMKSELSKRNPYYLPRNRYLELKYYCLQVPKWEENCRLYSGLLSRPDNLAAFGKRYGFSDPTFEAMRVVTEFSTKVDRVKKASEQTDPVIGNYIFTAVTKGYSYDAMNANSQIPCGREEWYKLYRKFFYILSNSRD